MGGATAVLAVALAAAPVGSAGPTPAACARIETARQQPLLNIPFRTVDGRIYVDAQVNGKGPFVFAIDTGASGMGRADASLVAALALPLSGSGETSDGIATAPVAKTRLATLDLGGFVRRDLEVITRDYASKTAPEAAFAGIVGRDFFADGLLVIDYPRRTLTFSRAASLAPGDRGVLGYSRAFRVPVTIGAVETEGNLDTGANVTFVLPTPLFDRIGGGAVTPAGEGTLTNTKIDTGRAMLRGPVRIGAAEQSNVEVRVSDRYPELLVGAHALEHFAILIDQRTKSVALCPSTGD
ncbi:aspartyl protease family protein [Allosphingosinicella indica]|uniref:Aspartyl protease n=1 Tax=Allosphingosinicella indica TaxID=941907 RepID=A0A1X7G8C3_9SPHN|nr:aspartyl protease family protein [Allosphingosinicella indica]SMF65819.1 Aspartyl protease [Allosphingosinicella indica]